MYCLLCWKHEINYLIQSSQMSYKITLNLEIIVQDQNDYVTRPRICSYLTVVLGLYLSFVHSKPCAFSNVFSAILVNYSILLSCILCLANFLLLNLIQKQIPFITKNTMIISIQFFRCSKETKEIIILLCFCLYNYPQS